LGTPQRAQIAPPPQVQNTRTIRSDINLKKESLQIELIEGTSKLSLSFVVDSCRSVRVEVYFCAVENSSAWTRSSSAGQERFLPLRTADTVTRIMPPGLGQRFAMQEGEYLDLTAYECPAELTVSKGDRFPIIIHLTCINDDGTEISEANGSNRPPDFSVGSSKAAESSSYKSHAGDKSRSSIASLVLSQTTFAAFSFDGDSRPDGVKALKQKIEVGHTRYVLQEIYGLDASAAAALSRTQQETDPSSSSILNQNTASGDVALDDVKVESEYSATSDDDGMSECVICMTEPRDTTVLNCRHMCLCHKCADELRFKSNKCPICRQPISSLLRLKVKVQS
jgi:E3 ubiquitin-protein ligase MGRN1